MAEPVTRREEAVVEARVEEAVAMKLLAPEKRIVVEVAISLVESLVQGNWKVVERDPRESERPCPKVRAPIEPPEKAYGI